MMPAEPSLAALPNPWVRYALATRLPFLSVTLVGCVIGLAAASADGAPLSLITALATVVFALLAHAGVNVINDYHDQDTDRINDERVFPFTGGSRFIQNGVMSPAEARRLGLGLLAAVIPAGVWLAWRSGPELLAVGMAGLLIGWVYSAPPLRLNRRGLGETCVAAGFTLIVVGTDFVQRGSFALQPLAAGVSYALMVTNILYINQFPDLRADAAAGKRNWVVILGPRRARWGYALIGLAAHLWIVAMAVSGTLPIGALAALGSAPLALKAHAGLHLDAETPARLAAPIRLTIAAALSHGTLLAAGLVAGSP